MATDPAASQAVTKNALVNLVVSGGQPEGDVLLTPDFVGKNVPTSLTETINVRLSEEGGEDSVYLEKK